MLIELAKGINRRVAILFLISFLSISSTSTLYAETFGEPRRIQDFLGRTDTIFSLSALEAMGLQASALPERPWSGSYWPDRTGSVAAPYEFFGFTTPLFWKWHRSIILKQLNDLRSGDLSESELDKISPAEKYDLLVGDPEFTFTRKVIERVNYLSKNHHTSLWSGICHGWAPASLTLERPLHAFSVSTPSGRTVQFYPTDVKALASFLWAESFAQDLVKVEGWQCRGKAKTDENGRLVDPKCFDVNPAFVHLALTNQLGLNRRGVIIDRSYKYPVRNQPVFAYRYTYFNPSTGVAGGTLKESSVDLSESYNDPFKKYRSPFARSIVGVELTAWYAAEVKGSHMESDSPSEDKSSTLDLRYDLELNEQGEIVGGEWRKYMDSTQPTVVEQIDYAHPDILWLVPNDLKAWSIADGDLNSIDWSPDNIHNRAFTPAEQTLLRESSIKASGALYRYYRDEKEFVRPNPQPLARIVDFLIEKSRR